MESQRRCTHTLPHQASSLAFSKDGKTLVSSSGKDNTVKLWDVNTGELKQSLTGLASIALSEDGKTLAGSKNDNTIELWDIETGCLKKSLTGHSSSFRIAFIAFNTNGKLLVSRNYETLNLWDINTGELKINIAFGRRDKCLGSVFSPNGQILAIYIKSEEEEDYRTFYTTIILLDVETGQEISRLNTKASTYYQIAVPIAFSHDGETLFISFNEDEADSVSYLGATYDYRAVSNYTQLWNLATNQISKTFYSSNFRCLSPDGRILIGEQEEYHTSDKQYSIRIYDVETGNQIKTFPGITAALSPDGKTLAILSEDCQGLKLLDWSSGVPIATLIGTIKDFAFSPDGNILAVADGSTIKLWQESTEPIIKQQLHGDAYPQLKRLENLLAAELWEDADLETVSVIEGFPNLDLNVVDQLWIHYSNGRYGFSKQKKIWDVLLAKEKRSNLNGRPVSDEYEFMFRVGWLKIGLKSHYHGDDDEYIDTDQQRTRDGYYPRNVHKHDEKRLLEVFAKLR